MFATLCALVGDPAVTHVAVAFDSVVSRAGSAKVSTDEGLIGAQTPLAADVVRALGITIWPAGRFQADELLASGARRYADEPGVEQVVVCTTDVDLFQCVRGERVVVLDRSRQRVTTETAVVERFGVAPALLADLFALVGDRSDGIAGVPGWGLRSGSRAHRCIRRARPDPRRPRRVARLGPRARSARELTANGATRSAALPRSAAPARRRTAARHALGSAVARLRPRRRRPNHRGLGGDPDLAERVPRWR
jgi:hypothetical protein